MNFNFQYWKPIIQQEFDAVLESYPLDLTAIRPRIPLGGNAMERRMTIVRMVAEECPVYVYDHFPFAFEVSMGQVRDYCHGGIGELCRTRSGVDFTPLEDFGKLLRESAIGSFGLYTDYLHRTFDHDKLLAKGFRGVYEDCISLNKTETDPEKRAYRESIMALCRFVEHLGLRLKEAAKTRLANAPDDDARYNLQRIVDAANTPWEAPNTMFEALSSLMCTALLISQMDGINAHAFGSVDRLIHPFYQRDLQAGRITPEEAEFLLQCFLFKTDAHAHYSEKRKSFDNGVTVMIGGCDLEGNPVYNEITEMILRCYMQNKLINPKLNARAGRFSPRPYLEKLAALILSGGNNIIVENDEYIIPMFRRMGLSAEDARTYVGCGCQEVICRHQIHSRAFIYLSLPQVLLQTLDCIRHGAPTTPVQKKLFQYGQFEGGSYDALYRSFMANLRSYIRVIAETCRPYEKIHHQINPEPTLSCFTDDCIARGLDISHGGARYNHKTLSLFGFGTLCDSLLSLRQAYADGTADTLLAATEADFVGYDALRKALQSGENRFGHSEEADRFARGLADALAQVSRGIYNAHGIEWRTSLFSYSMFHTYGQRTAATPDGRRAGETLSRQMNMASPPELTAAARSLSQICDADFNDVCMFDIALPLTNSEHHLQALTDYLRTCIELKIPVLQTNAVSRAMLMEERQCRGTHPGLVVRICGYSALFSMLTGQVQDEIIARTAI